MGSPRSGGTYLRPLEARRSTALRCLGPWRRHVAAGPQGSARQQGSWVATNAFPPGRSGPSELAGCAQQKVPSRKRPAEKPGKVGDKGGQGQGGQACTSSPQGRLEAAAGEGGRRPHREPVAAGAGARARPLQELLEEGLVELRVVKGLGVARFARCACCARCRLLGLRVLCRGARLWLAQSEAGGQKA